jgi:hypothetical protein
VVLARGRVLLRRGPLRAPQEPVDADETGAARALDLFLLGCQSRVVGELRCCTVTAMGCRNGPSAAASPAAPGMHLGPPSRA